MVGLVRVAHQAVVAGGLAVEACGRCVAEVLAGRGVVVADLERRRGDASELAGVVDQPTKHAGATLGRLVEQDRAAVVRRRERLGGELVVLELVHGADRTLECRLHRGEGGLVLRLGELEQEGVLAILDVRDDRRPAWAHRILGIEFVRLVPGPVAVLRVEHEATLAGLRLPSPAHVHAPDLGAVAEGERRDRCPRRRVRSPCGSRRLRDAA